MATEEALKDCSDSGVASPFVGLLATYDDEQSVGLKTRYALNKNLGGIMFWQLYDDKFARGLLDAITNVWRVGER